MQNKKGFTLVEILVSVTIIGILSTIMIPQYKSMKLKAEAVNLYTYMNTLEKDMVNYKSTYGVYPRNFSQMPSVDPKISANQHWDYSIATIYPEIMDDNRITVQTYGTDSSPALHTLAKLIGWGHSQPDTNENQKFIKFILLKLCIKHCIKWAYYCNFIKLKK